MDACTSSSAVLPVPCSDSSLGARNRPFCSVVRGIEQRKLYVSKLLLQFLNDRFEKFAVSGSRNGRMFFVRLDGISKMLKSSLMPR